MNRPFRPFRSRLNRLLATVLVTMALLVNGVAVAQAAVGAMKKDCCAEMMGHKAKGDDCGKAGKPCPAPSSDCEDQCLMRCQANNVLPSVAVSLPGISLPQPSLPTARAGSFISADPDPGLRPPISA